MKIHIEKTMDQDKRTHCKICVDVVPGRLRGRRKRLRVAHQPGLHGTGRLHGAAGQGGLGGPVGKESDMIGTTGRREEALGLVEDTASRSVFQRHSHLHHLLTVRSWEGYLTAPCLMFSPARRR